MRYGIIDIGTNTIRGVAYERKGEKTEDKLVRSHILQETADGCLSENGINRLIVVINKLVQILRSAECEKIGCFATSSATVGVVGLTSVVGWGAAVSCGAVTTSVTADSSIGVSAATKAFFLAFIASESACARCLVFAKDCCKSLAALTTLDLTPLMFSNPLF